MSKVQIYLVFYYFAVIQDQPMNLVKIIPKIHSSAGINSTIKKYIVKMQRISNGLVFLYTIFKSLPASKGCAPSVFTFIHSFS